MPPPFESTTVARLRSPWSRWFMLAFVATLSLPPLASHALGSFLSGFAPVAALVAFSVWYSRNRDRVPRRRREVGMLRIDGAGVHWNDRLVLPRGRAASGIVMHSDQDGTLVRFATGRSIWNRLELGVKNGEEGAAIVAAMGLEASRTVAAFTSRVVGRARVL